MKTIQSQVVTSSIRHTIAACFVAAFLAAGAALFAETPQTRSQIIAFSSQISQLTLDIESKKLLMLDARTRKDARAGQNYENEIKRLSATLSMKRQELTIWQQQAQFENQVPSPNPSIQAVKIRIQQLTFEKAYMSLKQSAANQAGNQAAADALSAQITARQNEIQARQQEIKLIELKAKAAAPR